MKVDVAVAVIDGVRVGVDVAALATFTRNSPAAQPWPYGVDNRHHVYPPPACGPPMTVVNVPAGINATIDEAVLAEARKLSPVDTRNVSPIPIPPDATAVGVRVGGGDGVVPDTTSSRNSPAAHPVPSGVDNCHQVNRWQIVAHR